MSKLNNESFYILFRQGTDANLQASTTYLQQGEPGYTTDTRKLYIADGSNNKLAIPVNQAKVDLTTQSASISATTLYAVPAGGAGFYRINWVASVTTAATSSSTLGGSNGFQIVYTDSDDSVSKTSPASATSAANTTGTQISGTVVVWAKASTNIQYQIGYTSSGVTAMQFNLHVRIEAL